MNQLKEVGIGTSIYYPHPVPSMSYYIETYGEIKCPNAEAISNAILALPVGPHLNPGDMVRIAEELIKVVNNSITING